MPANNRLKNRRHVLTGLLAVPVAVALPGASAPAAGRGADVAPISGAGQLDDNETLRCIMTRRSVRSFTSKPVEEDLLRQVLAAGMQAPSAGNEQPWAFIVVTDPSVLARLAQVHSYAHFAAKAPLGIVVCADLSKARLKNYWPLDLAACMENMLLAAHALGLGAVWTGIYPEEERIRKVTEICAAPEGIAPFALAVMGHPARTPPSEDRFDEGRIHHNAW